MIFSPDSSQGYQDIQVEDDEASERSGTAEGGAGGQAEGNVTAASADSAGSTGPGGRQVRMRQMGVEESLGYGGPVRIQPDMRKKMKLAQALYVACGGNSILSVECSWLTRLIQVAMDAQRE